MAKEFRSLIFYATILWPICSTSFRLRITKLNLLGIANNGTGTNQSQSNPYLIISFVAKNETYIAIAIGIFAFLILIGFPTFYYYKFQHFKSNTLTHTMFQRLRLQIRPTKVELEKARNGDSRRTPKSEDLESCPRGASKLGKYKVDREKSSRHYKPSYYNASDRSRYYPGQRVPSSYPPPPRSVDPAYDRVQRQFSNCDYRPTSFQSSSYPSHSYNQNARRHNFYPYPRDAFRVQSWPVTTKAGRAGTRGPHPNINNRNQAIYPVYGDSRFQMPLNGEGQHHSMNY